MTKAQILREVQAFPLEERLELAAQIRAMAEEEKAPRPKDHWKKVAEKLDQQGFLDGRSDEVKKLLKGY